MGKTFTWQNRNFRNKLVSFHTNDEHAGFSQGCIASMYDFIFRGWQAEELFVIQTAFLAFNLDQEGSCLLLLCRPVSRISLAVPSVWVSAFRNDVLLRGPFPPKLLFDTWKNLLWCAFCQQFSCSSFSTQLNIIVSPAYIPASYLSKSLASLPFGEKHPVLVEIWSITSLCTVFKIRWLLVWCNFIFGGVFLSCQLHHHPEWASAWWMVQPVFFRLLCNLWNILKVGRGGEKCTIESYSLESAGTVCFICSMTCASIRLSSPYPSIQKFVFLFCIKEHLTLGYCSMTSLTRVQY